MITIEYIELVIEKLKREGADFNDIAHFGTTYKRYLDRFNKAKELISLSSDTTTLFPLEDPRELIYTLYHYGLDNEEDREKLLQHFNRRKVDTNIIRDFEELDRTDHWKPSDDLAQKMC